MTWPMPPLDAPSLSQLLGPEGPVPATATVAALGAGLASLPATAEDDALPPRRNDAASLERLLERLAPLLPPALEGRMERVVRAAFERTEPWLDIRKRQGHHRGVLDHPRELRLSGQGAQLRFGREPCQVRADPLEELATLQLAFELAGAWAEAEALAGAWLAYEPDPRAAMLLPLLKVISLLRQVVDHPSLAPGRRFVLLRHAWSLLCAPARRPRVLLITGSSAPLRSAVGHALLARLRTALLIELEPGAPDGEWLGSLSGGLADLQLVILQAPVRPAALDPALRALVSRCDQTHLVRGADPFPAAPVPGVRRVEAALPEEVIATAILASVR